MNSPALRRPQRSTEPLEALQTVDAPEFTLCLPVSRPWAWERWLEHFRAVVLPPRTECIAIVDHDDPLFFERVREGLRTLKLWAGLRVLFTRRPAAGEWADLGERRRRISGHWATFLDAAQGRVILGAEDDTLPDWDAYQALVGHVVVGGAVFAQGTCIGRWDAGMVPHWTCTEDARGPVEWRTGTFEGQDVVPISGGGWFCFAAQTEALRQVDFYRGMGDSPVGPDVWTCYQLSKLGRCVGDWRVQAIHFAETMDLSPNRTVVDLVSFQFEAGRWRRRITAGNGRVLPGREVQLAGSQPRPVANVVHVRFHGDGTSDIIGTDSAGAGKILSAGLA